MRLAETPARGATPAPRRIDQGPLRIATDALKKASRKKFKRVDRKLIEAAVDPDMLD